MPDEWDTLLRLAGDRRRPGPRRRRRGARRLRRARARPPRDGRPALAVAGRDPAELLAALEPRRGPERMLDLMLRCGPVRRRLRRAPRRPHARALEAAPHGIDLGALEPRLPEVLRTPSGQDRAGARADRRRRRAAARGASTAPAPASIVLVGRRDLRSNNSWMHNLPRSCSGPARCTAARAPRRRRAPRPHRRRARARHVAHGRGRGARSRSPTTIMPGVVSIPHGWGHDAPGVELTSRAPMRA